MYLSVARIQEGLIAVVGGFNNSNTILDTNEVYNHASNSWSSKAAMPTSRGDLGTARIRDGLIAALGGSNNISYLSTNEVYSY
jgi:hypothetical protein